MPLLHTSRLTIVPFGLELVEAALRSREELGKRLLVEVPESWPGPDYAEVLPGIAEWGRVHGGLEDWAGLIIHPARRKLIGDIGFKGGPDEHGRIEIGYSVVPEERRQGYASEAVRAMIDWALQQPGVKTVVAECEVDNTASIRVLEKAGLRQVGMVDGLLKWEL